MKSKKFKKIKTNNSNNPQNNLSNLQFEILKANVNNDKLRDYGYTLSDIFTTHLDLSKNIERLPDIDPVTDMIAEAVRSKKNVLLVSDYDADGLTSASVMHFMFKDYFHHPEDKYHNMINQRILGNGINDTLVKDIKELHDKWPVDLMITADHGSSDNKAYAELKAYGIKNIIVTDHHGIDVNNPPVEATYLINPQRDDSTYFKDVSGCFIAFITLYHTLIKLKPDTKPHNVLKLLPYVAFSTISDVMSLDNPINRQVVQIGLREMNRFRSPVWLAIRQTLSINTSITYKEIGFKLSPLVNTGNRSNNEKLVFSLLIEEDLNKAKELASQVGKLNAGRKKKSKEINSYIASKLPDYKKSHSIVCYNPDTTLAINGVIANQIGESNGLPTVCFSPVKDKDVFTGSARAVLSEINIGSIFASIKEKYPGVIISGGGHSGGGGCTIPSDKFDEFTTYFNEEAKIALKDRTVSKEISYLIDMPSSDITPSKVLEVYRLSPYGKNWEEPKFKSSFKLTSVNIYGTVCKLNLITNTGNRTEAMWFFKETTDITIDNIKNKLKPGDIIDIVYTLSFSDFRGVIRPGLDVIDVERKQ